MDPNELNVRFFSLVGMYASACWQQLGKTPDQADGTFSRDLKGAQSSIGMLVMLREKTQGNLTRSEEKLLNDTITALQERYAEEAEKGSV